MTRVDRFLNNTGVNLEVAWGNLIATGVDGAQVIRPISTVHRPPFSHPGHRTINLANAKLPPPFPDIDAVMRLSCRDLDTLPWVKSRRNSGLNRRNWQTPLLKSETLAVPRNSDLQEVASPVQTPSLTPRPQHDTLHTGETFRYARSRWFLSGSSETISTRLFPEISVPPRFFVQICGDILII